MATPRSIAQYQRGELEFHRQEVLRDVKRGQADVEFLKKLDRYRRAVRAHALAEARKALEEVK